MNLQSSIADSIEENTSVPESLGLDSFDQSNSITKLFEPESSTPEFSPQDYAEQSTLWPDLFKQESFVFLECPSIADGYYPHCRCRYGPEYDKENNTCPNPVCPTNSTANFTYPQCDCSTKGRNFAYSELLNDCYRSCPDNASG